jgi:choline dehydrogenase
MTAAVNSFFNLTRTNMNPAEYDYVVVGSGAGGGPLAANLAKAGFKVFLMEAGGDPCSEDEMGRFMYEVPIFHGLSTEYKLCAWDFFVRHYTDDAQQAMDSKKVVVEGKDTIWYPRAAALGGCTAHNAMITVVPQDSDWNYIAEITGDESWRAKHMRTYFARLENCKYVPPPGSLKGIIKNLLTSIGAFIRGRSYWRDWNHGHGFKGWLPTCEADPRLVLKDKALVKVILDAVKGALHDHVGDPLTSIATNFDPNDSRNAASNAEGVAFTPLAVEKGKRRGPREYVLRMQKECEERRKKDEEVKKPDDEKFQGELVIKKHALATRILFDKKKAIGVKYIDKAHVYRADPQAGQETTAPASLPSAEVRVKREVIIAGGAFNSPQLLKLSGVGPREELGRFGIPLVVDLPGVGENLQDRYEVGIITEFKSDFALLAGGTFAPTQEGQDPDSFMAQWTKDGTGVYASNGALIGIIKRSRQDLPDPDLYIFGLPGFFKGYSPGYSGLFERKRNKFTWAILKARTTNTGRVELASANPLDRPLINFQYFGDGQRQNDPDLDAIVDGVKFVRNMNDRLQAWSLIKGEELPGPNCQSDQQLREFIRNEAWGHHASCTNKIGADNDPMAVLDSRFRVRGTTGLRVVDASVFPKIPGYFIVAAIYMVSEKAADVIIEDAR